MIQIMYVFLIRLYGSTIENNYYVLQFSKGTTKQGIVESRHPPPSPNMEL